MPAGSSLYGTGEVNGPLLRNDQSIRFWNTDNYAYKKDDGRRLYQSHPWVLGVRPDGTAFGIIFNTTWKAELQTASNRITLRSEGALFRVVVIDLPSPQAVVQELAELTGKMPMPPLWALGFYQCRYPYYPDARVRQIADEFRARRIPCDVIWMDIDHMQGLGVFTFDPAKFPDPKATNDYLHQHAFHSVWMIDPGVKVDPDYSVYQSGEKAGLWVQAANGDEFHGKVWPGACVFPDFTMPATRQWWSTANGPLTFLICLDSSDHAEGMLYEDTGDGFGYAKEDYALTRYVAVREADTITVKVADRQGSRTLPERKIQFRVVTAKDVLEGSGNESDGVRVAIKQQEARTGE